MSRKTEDLTKQLAERRGEKLSRRLPPALMADHQSGIRELETSVDIHERLDDLEAGLGAKLAEILERLPERGGPEG